MAGNWYPHIFISFTEETTVMKVAGPGASIEYEGLDFNGNYRYKMNFLPGHEFGDGQVDVNAGLFYILWRSLDLVTNSILEFREMGGNPVVEWAWTCPLVAYQCAPSMNPFKISGDGSWECAKKRNGRTTSCKVVCADGKIPVNGNTKARCDTYTNNKSTAGLWRNLNKGLHGKYVANCEKSSMSPKRKFWRIKKKTILFFYIQFTYHFSTVFCSDGDIAPKLLIHFLIK